MREAMLLFSWGAGQERGRFNAARWAVALGLLALAAGAALEPAAAAGAPTAARVTRKFKLAPRGETGRNPVQAAAFARRVVEAARTYLYTPAEAARAASEGRAFYYDAAQMELTLTDSPERVDRIARYLAALPELSPSQPLVQAIYVRHQPAAAILRQFIQLATDPGAGGGQASLTRLLERVAVTTSARPNELLVSSRDDAERKNVMQLLQVLDQPEKQFEVQVLLLEKKGALTPDQGWAAFKRAIGCCEKGDFDAAARWINADLLLKATALHKIRSADRQPVVTRLEKSHALGAPADSIELSTRLNETSGGRMRLEEIVVKSITGGVKNQAASSAIDVGLGGGAAVVTLPGAPNGNGPSLPCLFITVRRVQ